MSDWRDLVREELLFHQARTGDRVLSLDDVYRIVLPDARERFPDNNHPKDKIRQILQQLERRGELRRVKPGVYELVDLDERSLDPMANESLSELRQQGSGRESLAERVRQNMDRHESSEPQRSQRVVEQLLRNETIVSELKDKYDSTCQLCGTQRLQKPDRPYAECHHIQPLGGDVPGPDRKPNLLVLCPNHHTDFDYGMVRIEPDSYVIEHAYDEEVHTTMEVRHDVGDTYLEYHNREIAAF